MANAKEIQNRIRSIQDTMKITSAMYMIASSKMQKARKALDDTLPFFEEQQRTVAKFVASIEDLSSPFFGKHKNPEDITRGYVIITADKGLAGAYNQNVIRMAEAELKKCKNNRLYVMGELGRQHFTRRNIPIEGEFRYTVQDPTLYRARSVAASLVDQYLKDELDEIYIIYTKMQNTFKMEATKFCLLPLEREEILARYNKEEEKYEDIVSFFPPLEQLLDHMVPNVVSGYIYGALVESYASEQNSRMQAMQNATDNAKQMLHDLEIAYNRVRQAAITQEITEVIAGAKAQKNRRK